MAKNCLVISSGIICPAVKTSSLPGHHRKLPAVLKWRKRLPKTAPFSRILFRSSCKSHQAVNAMMTLIANYYLLYPFFQIFTLTYLPNSFSDYRELTDPKIVGKPPSVIHGRLNFKFSITVIICQVICPFHIITISN